VREMINAITGQNNCLYDRLKEDIQEAREMKFIVSFLMESGVKFIIDDLKKAIDNGAILKIITGTYLNITEPSAIYYLKDKLEDNVEIKFFNVPDV
jgi:HKD family nuclease